MSNTTVSTQSVIAEMMGDCAWETAVGKLVLTPYGDMETGAGTFPKVMFGGVVFADNLVIEKELPQMWECGIELVTKRRYASMIESFKGYRIDQILCVDYDNLENWEREVQTSPVIRGIGKLLLSDRGDERDPKALQKIMVGGVIFGSSLSEIKDKNRELWEGELKITPKRKFRDGEDGPLPKGNRLDQNLTSSSWHRAEEWGEPYFEADNSTYIDTFLD